MPALFPLLISLAGQFGPSLTGMLLGQQAGNVATTVVKVAKEVFGSDDPEAIAAAAKANPDLTALYIERVKADTEQFKAALVDVEGARNQTVDLVNAGSVIAWGAPTVSVIVVIGFVTLMSLWLFHPPTSDPALLSVLNIMVGTLASAFGAVVQYWLGSSAGSKQKDDSLSSALVTSQANTHSAITNGKTK